VRRSRRLPWVAFLAATLAGAAPAGAAGQGGGSSGTTAPAPANAPDLNHLLKLPGSLDYGFEKKGGATRSEWRARFHEARASVATAQDALAKAQQDLSAAAGESDAWTLKPPGMPVDSNSDAPDSYRLRQEVRKQRGEVERAQARLRDLEVQANLAGVPEDWRGPRTEPSTKNESVPPEAGHP
jgi:hypothetical protein